MADHPGQPLLFKTKEDLQEKIDAYFNSCYTVNEERVKECTRPLTIS